MKLAITWMFGLLAAGAVFFGGYGDDRAGTSAAGQPPVPCPEAQPQNAASPFDDPGSNRNDDTWQEDRERERMERGEDLQERRDQVPPDVCEPPGTFQSAA
ncbi:hypothetical protein ACGFIU_21325 [Rhodococcus oryzae]|uniref:hypothetical protein n=1 Tax=Rhodococcus oryzae TaxID=2571143 RepID=UPI0037206E3A